ncbi:MAG: PD40 domain-containing protein [Anaerolineae bacterium]|nr:PD40 domain-containing protein [Anaerolineae bacterium]
MYQTLQDVEQIEADYKGLSLKYDQDEFTYDEFVKRVDALPHCQLGGKEWRLNRAGEWVYLEGHTWLQGDIRQHLASEAPTFISSPLLSPSSSAEVPKSSPKPSPKPLFSAPILIIGTVAVLLLIIGLSILFWAVSQLENPIPTVVAVASPVISPTLLQSTPTFASVPPTPTTTLIPPTLTPTPIPPTSTPTFVSPTTPLIPATPTVTPSSPSVTPTPSPLPEATATPTFTPASEAAPIPIASPTPSLQGKIAYADYDLTNETFHIYLLDLSTVSSVKFIENAAEPSLRPDGKQIAYRSWAGDRRGLWVQNLDGSDSWQLSRGHESSRPQWSLNGDDLIFSSRQSGDRHWRLYYALDETISIPGPAWAADWSAKDKLIFAGTINENPGLYTANLDGSNVQSLTSNQTDTAPAVSFDGRYIAYTSLDDSENNWDVYIVTNEGIPIRRLTTDPARDGIPAWSPNSNYIAFASDRGGGWGIWVIDAAAQDQPRLLASLAYGLDLHPLQATQEERHDWTMHTITWSP